MISQNNGPVAFAMQLFRLSITGLEVLSGSPITQECSATDLLSTGIPGLVACLRRGSSLGLVGAHCLEDDGHQKKKNR